MLGTYMSSQKKKSGFIGTAILVVITLVICVLVVRKMVWPGYVDPQSRMYTSKLGYAAVLRKQGKPFPVIAGTSQRKKIVRRFLGEGMMRSEPVQVPVIAMSRIVRVHAKPGDIVKKGQLLAELDPSRIQIKVEAAKAQLKTAQAEFARTKIGSAYILEKERPERDTIRLNAATREVAIRTQLDGLYTELSDEGLMSKEATLLKRIENADALTKLQEAKLSLDVAKGGREHSLDIAKAAIRDAQLALDYREDELRDYQVYAPADGIIERSLIHEGEYNQDPGKPAFVIASGLWFEAYLDQSAIGQIEVGKRADVHLEALGGATLQGTVTSVLPIVSYSLGGPETNRPIRPMGTGTPEWPATFSIRIQLDASDAQIVPGLTGFVRIVTERESIAVPRGAVTKVSGNKAFVFTIDDDTFEPMEVTTGATSEGWTEIVSELEEDVRVIADGHQVLEPGDRIDVQSEFE